MSHRCFIESLTGDSSEPGQLVKLDDAEARHIARVMRMEPGDEIVLFDGQGHQCVATIDSVGKNTVMVQPGLVESVSREPATKVTLGVAIPKGDRLKFMIEKLTELGIHAVVPVDFQRSTVKSSPGNIGKMERYVIEASKQCGRNHLMRIESPIRSLEFLANSSESLQLWCNPVSSESIAGFLRDSNSTDEQSILLFVGPEGGFTDEESEAATRQNWTPVHLGSRILRTETAAIAASLTAIAVSDSMKSQD